MSTVEGVEVGPLEERDVAAADAVFRLAFGTALGLSEPARFAEGTEYVRPRWIADPGGAFGARAAGELVGVAYLSRWGTHAVFGPLAVRPDHWGRGVARALWEACLPLLDEWRVAHTALFTRGEPKNVHLYQTWGFWPGALTAITVKELSRRPEGEVGRTFGGLAEEGRRDALEECRRIAAAIEPGLDLEREIHEVAAQGLGATVLGDDAFAVCHAGSGSEAGPDTCYVKFAAVAPGADAAARLERLLDACEGYAAARGLSRLVAGVDTARREAYRCLLDRGHRSLVLGVAMHRPDGPAYDRPGVYALDDRR
jgi:GNAT superfamily N-acetyltransferase